MNNEPRKELKIALFIAIFMLLSTGVLAITVSSVTTTNITQTTAQINWQTDVASTGVVRYGTNTSNLAGSVSSTSLQTAHSVQLTGLTSGATYYYAVNGTDASGNSVYQNNGGNYFSFTASAPMFLNVNPIPAYVNTNNVNVIGTSRPNTQITVYVNGLITNFGTTTSGSFSFYNVGITNNAQNTINVTAVNSGEEVSVEFSVTSDTTTPVITLLSAAGNTVPPSGSYIHTTSFTLVGAVSEVANVTISVNGQTQYAQSTNQFTANLNLADNQQNTIDIQARDAAGNTVTQSLTYSVDSTPPAITQVSPTPGGLLFENVAKSITLTGKTEPNARVRLYINRTPCAAGQSSGVCAPDYQTTADSNGDFIFRRIDITRSLLASFAITQVPPGAQEGQVAPSYRLGLNFQTIDVAGNIGNTTVEYNVGICGSTDPFWSVRPTYQAPPILSTERLAAGTEQVSFIIEFNYTGNGQNPKLTAAQIRPECSGSVDWIRNDPRYNWSCRVVSQSPFVSEHNSAKTRWYWIFTLSKLPGAETWTNDNWKSWFSLTNSRMDFPFRVSFSYTHDIEGQTQSGTNLGCFSIPYTVDNVRINPKKVIPDELLKGMLSLTNKTISTIDNLQKNYLNPVTNVLGYACIGSWGYNTINKIFRIGSCATEKIAKDSSDCQSCMESEGLSAGSKKDAFSNDCLSKCYSRCSSNWQTEAGSYNTFRYACDRLFAHRSPAGSTANLPTAELTQKVEAAKTCGTKDTIRGARLVRSPRPCKDHSVSPTGVANVCFVKNTIAYKVADTQDPDCRNAGMETLTRIDQGRADIGSKAEIGQKILCAAKEESGSGYLVSVTDSCNKLCDRYGFDAGRSSTGGPRAPGSCPQLNGKDGTEFGYTSDYTPQSQTQCCCYPRYNVQAQTNVYPLGSEPTEKTPAANVATIGSRAALPENNIQNPWNYRYSVIKYGGGVYNPDRYYDGRDKPACYGQNDLFNKDKVELNPNTNFVNKVQCLAVGPLNAQLTNFKNIATGLQRCLTQIKVTGQANSAMCKQLFTVYVCSSLIEVLTYFKNKYLGIDPCDPNAKPNAKPYDFSLGLGIGTVYQAIDDSVKQFNEEYDNAAVQDYLGVGVDQVAHKICMGAFFHDWDISAKGLVSAAYSQPFESLVLSTAPPNKREFVTLSPVTSQATYSYTSSWLISPGCDISSYNVQLACVSQKEITEGKADIDCSGISCDCAQLAGEKTFTLFQGRAIRQNEQEEQGVTGRLITSTNRYDHLKIKLNVDSRIKDQCFPTEHSDGVYYFPLREPQRDLGFCQVTATGDFVCSGQQLFDKEGSALIQQMRINDQLARDELVVFKNDGLKIDLDIAQYTGDPKCILYDVENSQGSSDVGGLKVLDYPVEGDGTFTIGPVPIVISSLQAAVSLNGLAITSATTSQAITIPIEVFPGSDGIYRTSDANDEIKIGNNAQVKNSQLTSNGGLRITYQGATFVLSGSYQPTQQQGTTGTITIVPSGSVGQQDTKKVRVSLVNLKGSANGVFNDYNDCDINNPVIYRGSEQRKQYTITARAQSTAPSG